MATKFTCRRKRIDRRQEDWGPPTGWRERRRTTERRLPEVREDEVSEAEFFHLVRLAREALLKAQEEKQQALMEIPEPV